MFIDTAVTYSARAFIMLTRGLAAQHARNDLRNMPDHILRDLGFGHQAIAPVVRGRRYR